MNQVKTVNLVPKDKKVAEVRPVSMVIEVMMETLVPEVTRVLLVCQVLTLA